MITLRPYQEQAISAVMQFWADGGGNPLVDLATGTGKSMVIAELNRRLLAAYPTMRVLMLVHVRELVEQNYRALLRCWPEAPVGIYSAGLGKRDAHHRITFASIQSVFRKAGALGHRDLVLIDEAHLVPTAGTGMYRKLMEGLREECPDLRIAGFTATPYRLDSGRLDAGLDKLFDETVYSYGIGEGIADAFLSPLISKASAAEIDVSGVSRRGGEFASAELEAAASSITEAAVAELVRYGKDRRSWLIFCSGVRHALEVRDEIRASGIHCESVSGETAPAERDRILRDFKAGKIRALTNAQVLTTGFDAPAVDLVAMLRPTLSTSLYVQIVGRGTRLAPGKENCLILDFAGNVRRHGPVDAVSVGPKKAKGETDPAKVEPQSIRAKECPECASLAALNAPRCLVCGHEWPVSDEPRHDAEAEGQLGILSTEKVPPQIVPVIDWKLTRHEKANSPDSVKVTYFAGLSTFPEWVAVEHGGYARQKAQQWWINHGGALPFPKTVEEALARAAELATPSTITIKPNGKYFDIVGKSFPAQAKGRAA